MKDITLDEGEVIRLTIKHNTSDTEAEIFIQNYALVTDEWIEDLSKKAHALGKEAGVAAGSWVFDGRNSTEDYARIGKGIEDGDPEILDALPQPDLSGEWADGPTVRSIMSELGVDGTDHPGYDLADLWVHDEMTAQLADLWCDGFREGVEFEVTNTIRLHLIED